MHHCAAKQAKRAGAAPSGLRSTRLAPGVGALAGSPAANSAAAAGARATAAPLRQPRVAQP